MEFIDRKWDINDDELYLATEDGDDYYAYIISSYSAKGEQLYIGEKDGLTIVMGYISDDSWDETSIFVLRNENKDDTLAQ